MVIGVQYESDAARQVIIPDWVKAYQNARMSSIAERSGQLANRSAELNIQRAESEAPYAKKRMEQDIAKNDALMSKYSMDQKMAWAQFAQTFIPQAQTPQDLMSMVRHAQDALDMPDDVAQMALAGMPESLLDPSMSEEERQKTFNEYKQQLMYSTQLFEFKLQKELAKEKSQYDINLEKERTKGDLQVEKERSKRYFDEEGNSLYNSRSRSSGSPNIPLRDVYSTYKDQYYNEITGEWDPNRPSVKEHFNNIQEMFGEKSTNQQEWSDPVEEVMQAVRDNNFDPRFIDYTRSRFSARPEFKDIADDFEKTLKSEMGENQKAAEKYKSPKVDENGLTAGQRTLKLLDEAEKIVNDKSATTEEKKSAISEFLEKGADSPKQSFDYVIWEKIKGIFKPILDDLNETAQKMDEEKRKK